MRMRVRFAAVFPLSVRNRTRPRTQALPRFLTRELTKVYGKVVQTAQSTKGRFHEKHVLWAFCTFPESLEELSSKVLSSDKHI